MRRPVMYLAGLLLATGASLALAGPASAAPSHDTKCHHHNHGGGAVQDDAWWLDDDFPYGYVDNSNHEGHAFGLINLLSGNGGDGLSL